MTWIYFVREGDGGPIKIGRANDPWKRLDSLQTGNSRRLKIIAARRVGKSAHIAERDAHREFAEYALFGEWYTPSERLLDTIAGLGMPPCERCSAESDRLHQWETGVYGAPPLFLCFKCLNWCESDQIRKKEEAEAKQRSAIHSRN